MFGVILGEEGEEWKNKLMGELKGELIEVLKSFGVRVEG